MPIIYIDQMISLNNFLEKNIINPSTNKPLPYEQEHPNIIKFKLPQTPPNITQQLKIKSSILNKTLTLSKPEYKWHSEESNILFEIHEDQKLKYAQTILLQIQRFRLKLVNNVMSSLTFKITDTNDISIYQVRYISAYEAWGELQRFEVKNEFTLQERQDYLLLIISNKKHLIDWHWLSTQSELTDKLKKSLTKYLLDKNLIIDTSNFQYLLLPDDLEEEIKNIKNHLPEKFQNILDVVNAENLVKSSWIIRIYDLLDVNEEEIIRLLLNTENENILSNRLSFQNYLLGVPKLNPILTHSQANKSLNTKFLLKQAFKPYCSHDFIEKIFLVNTEFAMNLMKDSFLQSLQHHQDFNHFFEFIKRYDNDHIEHIEINSKDLFTLFNFEKKLTNQCKKQNQNFRSLQLLIDFYQQNQSRIAVDPLSKNPPIFEDDYQIWLYQKEKYTEWLQTLKKCLNKFQIDEFDDEILLNDFNEINLDEQQISTNDHQEIDETILLIKELETISPIFKDYFIQNKYEHLLDVLKSQETEWTTHLKVMSKLKITFPDESKNTSFLPIILKLSKNKYRLIYQLDHLHEMRRLIYHSYQKHFEKIKEKEIDIHDLTFFDIITIPHLEISNLSEFLQTILTNLNHLDLINKYLKYFENEEKSIQSKIIQKLKQSICVCPVCGEHENFSTCHTCNWRFEYFTFHPMKNKQAIDLELSKMKDKIKKTKIIYIKQKYLNHFNQQSTLDPSLA
jgi:hypothetical protein